MEKTKLLIAVMYSDKDVYSDCKNDLIELYGEISVESDDYDFDKFTKYYEKEMGSELRKRFLIFEKEVSKEELKGVKLKITEIEKKFSENDKRRINLDPGYVSDKELVLASFKKGTNFKEDVGDGIYLHKVLEFKNKEVVIFWHTFPDYKEKKEWFVENK